MNAGRIFSALASLPRRQMVAALAQSAASTSVLAERLRLSATAISRHLSVLEHAGLVPGAPIAPWEPFVVLRNSHPTDYRLVQLGDTVALEAEADEGGTGVYRKIKIAPERYPLMEWRWYVPRGEKGAPMSVASRSSPVV